jgi:hypothetical protein
MRTNSDFILHVLDDAAQNSSSLANTLEHAHKRIKEVTEEQGNIPLQTVARALLPLGFCVVHKDALSTALDAMTTVNTMENDITDDTSSAAFEKAQKHLQSALTGF